MSAPRKARILRAFDRARHYDDHARIQGVVATRLAERIAKLGIDPGQAALEIGCGTGFLTAALIHHWPDLQLIASDIAPGMVARTRKRIGEQANIRYEVIDADDPDALPDRRFGLIASSLTFQWIGDLGALLRRLVAKLEPGGSLAFSTLAAGTFEEWTQARAAAGLEPALRTYPGIAAIEAMVPPNAAATISHYRLTDTYAAGRDFLLGLKAIGAGTAWEAKPANPARLREAIRLFEAGGASVSYEIAEVAIRRKK